MATGRRKKEPPEEFEKKARIEVIPLIDVIFFLLATFVLFTLSLNRIQSIEISLPQAVPNARPQTDEDKPITLQVSEQGIYYWNQEQISLREVEINLDNYVAEEPNPRVLLTTDDLARYGDVIAILDLVRRVDPENRNRVQVSFETVFRPTGR